MKTPPASPLLPDRIRRMKPEVPSPFEAPAGRRGGGGRPRVTHEPPRELERSLFDEQPPAPVASVDDTTSTKRADPVSIRESLRAMWERDQSQAFPADTAAGVFDGVQSQDEAHRVTDAHVEILERALRRPIGDLFHQTARWLDPEAKPRTRRGEVIPDPDASRDAREAMKADLENSRADLGTLGVELWTSGLQLELDPGHAAKLRPAWNEFLTHLSELFAEMAARVDTKDPVQLDDLKQRFNHDVLALNVGVARELLRIPFAGSSSTGE